MKTRTLVRRLGMVLMLTALAAFVWGCGQTAPTAVADLEEPTLGTLDGDPPPPTDGDQDGWW